MSTTLRFILSVLLSHIGYCQLQGTLEGPIACGDSILGYLPTIFSSSWEAYSFDVTTSLQEITFSLCNYNEVDPLWDTRLVLYNGSQSQINDGCDYLDGSSPDGSCAACTGDINLEVWTITLSSGSYYIEVQGTQSSGNFRLDMDCITNNPTNVPTNHPTNIPTSNPTNIPTTIPTTIIPTTLTPTTLTPTTLTPTTAIPTTLTPTTTIPTTGTPTTLPPTTTKDDGAAVDEISTMNPTIPNGKQNIQDTNNMDPMLIALIVIGLFLFIIVMAIVGYYWLKKNRNYNSKQDAVQMIKEVNSGENTVELTTVDIDPTVQNTDDMHLQEDEDLYNEPGDRATVTGGNLQDYKTPTNDNDNENVNEENELNDVTEGQIQELDVTLGSNISCDKIANTQDDLYSKPVNKTKH
eukprot:476306_1